MPLLTTKERNIVYVLGVLLCVLTGILIWILVRRRFASQRQVEAYRSAMASQRIDLGSVTIDGLNAVAQACMEPKRSKGALVVVHTDSPRAVDWVASSLTFMLEQLDRPIVVSKNPNPDMPEFFSVTAPGVWIERDGRYQAHSRVKGETSTPKRYAFRPGLNVVSVEYHPEIKLDTIAVAEPTPDGVVLNLLGSGVDLRPVRRLAQRIPVVVIGEKSAAPHSGFVFLPPSVSTEVASAKLHFLLSNAPPDLIPSLFQISLRGEAVDVRT